MYVEVGRRIAERIHALKQLLKNMNLLSNEKRGRKREKKEEEIEEERVKHV